LVFAIELVACGYTFRVKELAIAGLIESRSIPDIIWRKTDEIFFAHYSMRPLDGSSCVGKLQTKGAASSHWRTGCGASIRNPGADHSDSNANSNPGEDSSGDVDRENPTGSGPGHGL
jgi:hypothetical protein